MKKKILYIIFIVLILVISVNLTPMECKGNVKNNENLVTLLLETEDKNKRIEIIMENKDIITEGFVEEFLKNSFYHSWQVYDNLLLSDAQKRYDVAMEMSDLLNNNRLRGIVMLYRAEAIYMNNIKEALSYYDQAMGYFQKDKCLIGEAWCYTARAMARELALRATELDNEQSDMKKAINL